jgi:(2Fe-2S) ferredoxin
MANSISVWHYPFSIMTKPIIPSKKPYFFATAAHILVCTGSHCAGRGSGALFGALWQGLEQEKLAYYKSGGNLRLTQSGCLGACQDGPTVACYFRRAGALAEAWYSGMDYPDTMNLARALHRGDDLPQKKLFGP